MYVKKNKNKIRTAVSCADFPNCWPVHALPHTLQQSIATLLLWCSALIYKRWEGGISNRYKNYTSAAKKHLSHHSTIQNSCRGCQIICILLCKTHQQAGRMSFLHCSAGKADSTKKERKPQMNKKNKTPQAKKNGENKKTTIRMDTGESWFEVEWKTKGQRERC